MSPRFEAAPHLAALKSFQRATVNHVTERFFGSDPTRRFLVADETGLGKSIVARGVVATTVERLMDDDSIDRIDIVYICSNQDIVNQNLARLNVVGQDVVTFRSRLTLLAKESRRLRETPPIWQKPINLIAFTPGTSLDAGNRYGMDQERALLAVVLRNELGLTGWDLRASDRLLQGTVRSLDGFRRVIERLLTETAEHGFDPDIVTAFMEGVRAEGLDAQWRAAIADVGRSHELSPVQREISRALVGKLRSLLARAGVAALEPDLVILDEFQRFRSLLDPESSTEAADLARSIFDWPGNKTLLLSATPYKPYSLAEEAGDDHHTGLFTTLDFLARGMAANPAPWLGNVRATFADFREAAISGTATDVPAAGLRDLLLQVMTRTERPQLGGLTMLTDVALPADVPRPEDLADFVNLKRLADDLSAPMSVDYWKSSPYFLNFVEGYKLGDRLKAADADDPDVRSAIEAVRRLNRTAVDERTTIELGNPRLRSIARDTTRAGWWRFLWMPSSLRYVQPGGVFAEPGASTMTKRLIFSSWNATPTAIASLLSHDAARLMVGTSAVQASESTASRLTYRMAEDGRPSAMTTLALFWPHPGLAPGCDPLAIARLDPVAELAADQVEATAARRVGPGGVDTDGGRASDGADLFWRMAKATATAGGARAAVAAFERTGPAEEEETGSRLYDHVDAALAIAPDPRAWAQAAPGSRGWLVQLGLWSPANAAWRALRRLGGTATPEELWAAAAALSSGLRSLFNRPETASLLDLLYGTDDPYWVRILRYCRDGNLEAVLDEWLHHLSTDISLTELDGTALMALARKADEVLRLRTATYRALDPLTGKSDIGLSSRFALRYGGKSQDKDSARPGDVRNAYNSPFWPFVLATTSAGQEGVDFHWWSHAVVHWNTPANPVDFEQREGRVSRYGGHAVRKNIALAHRAEALAAAEPQPWRAAFAAAVGAVSELGEFAPWWLYPGPAKVERHLLPLPLSRDIAKAARIKEELALYRLAFGQPRQEDLMGLIRAGGHEARLVAVDLRP